MGSLFELYVSLENFWCIRESVDSKELIGVYFIILHHLHHIHSEIGGQVIPNTVSSVESSWVDMLDVQGIGSDRITTIEALEVMDFDECLTQVRIRSWDNRI